MWLIVWSGVVSVPNEMFMCALTPYTLYICVAATTTACNFKALMFFDSHYLWF